MAQHEPQTSPNPSFASRHRRWWLPFALAVSLFVHLFLGFTVQHFGLLGTPPDPQADKPSPGVQVTLLSSSEMKEKEAPEKTPEQPKAPAPAATPLPTVKTPPQKERAVAKPGPTSVPATAAPPAVATPNAPPTPEAQPTPPPPPQPIAPPTGTTGSRVNRVPRPLPAGQENSPAVTPPQERPPVTVPDASVTTTPDEVPKAATRLKPTAPTRTPGEAGGGGEIASILTVPKVDAPRETLGATGGAGGNDTGGRGNVAAAGAGEAGGGNGIGITRGIPFGDTLGLSRRGAPDGGGGSAGVGAGGVERISGSGGGGPRYRIQRPAGGGPPLRIVYVLDVSGSMLEGGKMTRAQEALTQALDELSPEDSFMIVTFSNEASAYSPTLRRATPTAVAQGRINVRSAQPNGQTNISAGLELALSQKDATHIFLLSDGAPTRGIIDENELLAFIQRRNANNIRIITLALGMGEALDFSGLLKKMAQQNNGRYEYVNVTRR